MNSTQVQIAKWSEKREIEGAIKGGLKRAGRLRSAVLWDFCADGLERQPLAE